MHKCHIHNDPNFPNAMMLASKVARNMHVGEKTTLSNLSTVVASSELMCFTIEKKDSSYAGTAELFKACCETIIDLEKIPSNWPIRGTSRAVQSSSLILVTAQGKWSCFASMRWS